MEDFTPILQAKIDTQAPTWEMPFYDPNSDTD
jgi:hypothetical protein